MDKNKLRSKSKNSYNNNIQKIISAIFKGTENEVLAFLKINPKLVNDLEVDTCRSPLILACKFHRNRILLYLLSKGANINFQNPDYYNGNTPLHIAALYGNIDTYVELLQHGADSNTLNNMTLMPPSMLEYHSPNEDFLNDENECELNLQLFAWGLNSNYNLGLAAGKASKNPDWVDLPPLVGVYSHQFHSLFLTHSGHVFSCGHSRGGRLGLKASGAIVVPQKIKEFARIKIIAVDVGVDHSIFLSQQGTVFTCGLNSYSQLGLDPSIECALEPRPLKKYCDRPVVGVAAGAYHSCFWTSEELYTFGLNVGQLGHVVDPSCEVFVSRPRRVSALASLLMVKKDAIDQVAVSDAAIVVATATGDIFALHKHKVAAVRPSIPFGMPGKYTEVKGISCQGGTLQPMSKEATTKLTHHIPSDLCVVVHTTNHDLFVWLEKYSNFITTQFGHWKLSHVFQFCLNSNGITYVNTNHVVKECILTEVPADLLVFKQDKNKKHLLECLLLEVRSLLAVPRPWTIYSDPKGVNFFAQQYDPKTLLRNRPLDFGGSTFKQDLTLWSKTYSDPLYCDVVIECKHGIKLFGHSFLLSHFSKFFCKELTKCDQSEEKKLVLKIPNVESSSIQKVLNFTYYLSSHLHIKRIENKQEEESMEEEEEIISCPKDLIETFGIQINAGSLCRSRFSNLFDVWFECEDCDTPIGAHKCILMARSAHFEVSLSHRWQGGTDSQPLLKMAFSRLSLEALLEFLYTDDWSKLESLDVDSLSEAVVFANQFLFNQLFQICQQLLALRISLKNYRPILNFAETLEAHFLLNAVAEFIAVNLPTFMHNKWLKSLDFDILKSVTEKYKSLYTLNQRKMTSALDLEDKDIDWLTDEELRLALDQNPSVEFEEECHWLKEQLKVVRTSSSASKNQKKRRSKPRSRNTSSSSNSEAELSLEVENFSFEDLVDREDLKIDTEWSTVGKKPDGNVVVQTTVVDSPLTPTTTVISPLNPTRSPTTDWFPSLEESKTKTRRKNSFQACPTEPVNLVNSSGPVWGGSSAPSTVDFNSLMTSQSTPICRSFPPPLGKKFPRKKKKSAPDESPVQGEETPKKGWGSIPVPLEGSSPLKCPPDSKEKELTAIMEDEASRSKNLKKSSNKPLHLIQLEERAMRELLEYYGGSTNPDEMVTVARVKARVADPVWNS